MGSEISIKKEMGGSRIGQRSWQVAVTKGKAMSSQGSYRAKITFRKSQWSKRE